MLDRPEAPIEDPELAAALRKRALSIHLKTVVATVLFTAAVCLCPA